MLPSSARRGEAAWMSPCAVGRHKPCRALAFQVVSGGQAAGKLLWCLPLAGGQGLL